MAKFLIRSKSAHFREDKPKPLCNDGITATVFLATDNESRDDLKPIGIYTAASASPSTRHRDSFSRPRPEVDRPRTSTGVPRKDEYPTKLMTFQPIEKPYFPAIRPISSNDTRPMPVTVALRLVGEHSDIGIALGSPSQSQTDSIGTRFYHSKPHNCSIASTTSTVTMTAGVPAHHLGYAPMRKNKGHSKWNVFGGIFRKRNAGSPPPATPFYQLGTTTPEPVPVESARKPRKSTSSRKKTRSPRPSDEATLVETKSNYSANQEKRPLTSETQDHARSEASEGNSWSRPSTSGAPAITINNIPHLEVDIPRTQMERYSVMFGDVLNPSPTLLQRRKTKLEKLHLHTPEEEEPCMIRPQSPRRATSPAAMHSPAFSLFPSTPSEPPPPLVGLPPRPISLRRARTAPASPGRRDVSFRTLRKDPPAPIKIFPVELIPSYPSSTGISPNPSPMSMNSADVIVDPTPLRPRVEKREPEWEMLPRPDRTAALRSESTLPKAPFEEAEQLIKDAANVSIARQVSKRQVMLPIVPRNERVVNRMKLTPTIVVLGGNGHRARKSHYAQLDSA